MFPRSSIQRRAIAVVILGLFFFGLRSLMHVGAAQEPTTPSTYPSTANLPKRELPPFNVSPPSAPAESLPADSAPAAKPVSSLSSNPKQVYVGVFLNQIDCVNLKDSQVTVDFHIWFRWLDDGIKPLETFDLSNGQITSKQDIYEDKIQGYHYAACRVLATIHKVWDVSKYPMDSHELVISIEDGEYEDFKQSYIADVANSGLNNEAELPGWVITPGRVELNTHHYNTNYGDISLTPGQGSNYSRFIYSVHISRPGYGIFAKLFSGLFIAGAIGLISLLIPASELDARFGLAVGAMFAAVASEYVMVTSLPEANYLTLADQFHIVTFIFIFLSLAVATLSHRAFANGMLRLARWTDRGGFVGLLLAYLLGIAGLIAMHS
jgi:hypothetical protein